MGFKELNKQIDLLKQATDDVYYAFRRLEELLECEDFAVIEQDYSDSKAKTAVKHNPR